MKIKMYLKDIVHDDRLVKQTGVNPYAINEGANPEALYDVEVESVNPPQEGQA